MDKNRGLQISIDFNTNDFWKGKLCIIILTYNRPERISYYLESYVHEYALHGIDFIVFDSSEGSETAKIVEEQISNGYNNLYYKKYNGHYDGKSLDDKAIAAYKMFCDRYEYIWLCRDGLIINFDKIQKKLRALVEKSPDFIIVDSTERTREKVGLIKEYDCCIDFFKDQCIRMVTLGTTILASKTFEKIYEENPSNDSNYTLWQAIAPFHYVANHSFKAVALYDKVFTYHPIRIRSSFWNSNSMAIWQWAYRWCTVLDQLPGVYQEAKQNLYKIKMVDFDPFGNQQLLIMKANKGLKLSNILKYKKDLTRVSNQRLWKIIVLSIIPIPSCYIRKVFQEEQSFTSKATFKMIFSIKKVVNLFNFKDKHRFDFLKKRAIKIKQHLLPPSSKSFHTKANHLEKQVNAVNASLAVLKQKSLTSELQFWLSINRPEETLEETKIRFFKGLPCSDRATYNIQIIIKDIMKDFDHLCQRFNLRYWLWGGSLLGAIRHDGFIPWDDDADVVMIREDFNKFINILKSLNWKYELNYCYDLGHPTWTCQIPKLQIKNSPVPVYLDIFPFDWTNAECRKFAKREYLCKRKEIEKEVNEYMKKHLLRKFESEFVSPQLQRDLSYIFEKHTATERRDGSHLFWGVDMHKADIGYVNKEDIFPLKKHKFHELELFIPHNFDKCLKMLYGDIYSLPPDAYSHFHRDFFEWDNFKEEIEEYIRENNLLSNC